MFKLRSLSTCSFRTCRKSANFYFSYLIDKDGYENLSENDCFKCSTFNFYDGNGGTYYFFFGEDIKSTNGPHASRPNSTAAQASFLGILSGVSTEDFQSASGSAPIALTFTGSSGALNATVTSGGSVETSTGSGRWSISSGTNYLEAQSSSFVLTFASQIAAFGFYGTDIGDFDGALSIEVFNGATSLGLFQVGNTRGSGGSTNGSVLFYGLVDTVNTFNRIVFRNTDTEDIFGFDNMTIGDVRQVTGTVPLPGSLALLGLGLVGLAGLRNKSQSKSQTKSQRKQ